MIKLDDLISNEEEKKVIENKEAIVDLIGKIKKEKIKNGYIGKYEELYCFDIENTEENSIWRLCRDQDGLEDIL